MNASCEWGWQVCFRQIDARKIGVPESPRHHLGAKNAAEGDPGFPRSRDLGAWARQGDVAFDVWGAIGWPCDYSHSVDAVQECSN